MSEYDYDVAIIGSGPSGIGAATALSKAGVKNIVVFEREPYVGGIPRHTHHPSFGLLVFKRPISGPKYIRALLKRCADVQFETSSTIVSLSPGGGLEVATSSGIKAIRARHIILATGARETPRHGRLITGLRPQGVTTTGALQQFVYSAKLRPFRRPVIVGTELVSFSALWTLKTSGAKPVAMIEENPRITTYRPAVLFAWLMRVPIYYNTTITNIGNIAETKHVEIVSSKGDRQTLDCDGVIFSGKFIGDNNLARASHLELNPTTQIPQIDQNWVSSDPAISVIGNTTHPADMGDQCYQEGLVAGHSIAARLSPIAGNGAAKSCQSVVITHDKGIKMTTPNVVRPNAYGKTHIDICLHVTKPYSGTIEVICGDQIVYSKSQRCMPARRIRLKNILLDIHESTKHPLIHITLKA